MANQDKNSGEWEPGQAKTETLKPICDLFLDRLTEKYMELTYDGFCASEHDGNNPDVGPCKHCEQRYNELSDELRGYYRSAQRKHPNSEQAVWAIYTVRQMLRWTR